jgi:hypothetical protein
MKHMNRRTLRHICLLLALSFLIPAVGCERTEPGREAVPEEETAAEPQPQPEPPETEAQTEPPETEPPETEPEPETEPPETEPETEPPETEPETAPPETEAETEPETETAPPETKAETAVEPKEKDEKDPKDPRDDKDRKDPEDTKDAKDSGDDKDKKDVKDSEDSGDSKDAKDAKDDKDKKDNKDEQKEEAKKEPTAAPPADNGIYSYLTGKPCTLEQQQKRPVAIMLNNLRLQLPQFGLDYGSIFYECVTEGAITRLMMIADNYENMGTVGSIRSSRDYFADCVADYDAIYVHAGGSPQAYNIIMNRGLTNLDGANMYLPSTYFRDPWRLNNIGYEHSLMTNGAGIVSGIQFKGYRTTHNQGYTPPLTFYTDGTNHMTGGAAAAHFRMVSTAIQTVDFVYDAKTGEYLRYHYNGIAHVDGSSGSQISVKNVIVLFTDIAVIPGDEAGRVAVTNIGSGSGYYLTNGQCADIVWSRSSGTDIMHYSYPGGDPLILNAGKTFICIVDKSAAKTVEFNHQW